MSRLSKDLGCQNSRETAENPLKLINKQLGWDGRRGGGGGLGSLGAPPPQGMHGSVYSWSTLILLSRIYASTIESESRPAPRSRLGAQQLSDGLS